MRKYVIMGVQGSGKGTQAKMLARDLDLVHISVGDIFRWNVQNHTKMGAQVRRIMAEHVGASESAEEQHSPLKRIRHRDRRGGRSNISNDAEYLVLLVELLHGVGGAGRLITVISRD